jgi:outer membrane protein TolC
MVRMRAIGMLIVALSSWGTLARADGEQSISYGQAIARARLGAPDLAVARGREGVARAEVGVAGVYPNPAVIAGTSTQAARFSIGASIPLVILGQRGASIRASRADLATVQVDTQVTWNDVRAAAAHAFVTLWLAQRTSIARADAAAVARRVDAAVGGKVELGAVPEVEGLRAHAERLRADADAQEAEQLVAAAGAELGRWLASPNSAALRAQGDPDVPVRAAPLAELLTKVNGSPSVRREESDAHAAEARADRERALARPIIVLDVGADMGDPTLTGTNYRAQLAVEVPIINRRGAQVEREHALASAARARSGAERARLVAALESAYHTFNASSARATALATGVVPAAEAAATATEEAYTLGRAPLVALLDAARARIDARLALLDAQAARANAWIEVEHAVGGQP